ncbi:efflux RND transporter permease subunit [Luteimonas sp. FCS-9]|uniref:efflux RND transporter permease subunit n=1 Tax=Luteimonas sp. FCS-9 TaxID=1547516 RepID=UPI00063E7EEA|nr:efflux RND transporter permease subunit [Luteimonas sp. FCS-9]KLJ01618.1 acriflavin resistance protein [Luteimonas sp. FCS-9]
MAGDPQHGPAGDGPAVDPHAAPPGRFDLVEFSTRRRVTVWMVAISLMLFGLIALTNLKVNLLPDLSYPTLTVRTEYTGAAPAEIETLVSEPVEEAVGVVKGVRKLRSISRTGQSDVVLEFAWGTDMDQASLEVRDKLETLSLPLEVTPPVLLRFNPSTEPILRLALTAGDKGDAVDELTRMRRYADDDLKKKLEPVVGVAAVKVGGGFEDEVQVDLDLQQMARIGLPIENVIQRLQQENINLSGGRLDQGTQRYLVRTVNQFATVEQIGEMLVATQTGGDDAAASAAQQMAAIAAASGSQAVLAAAASVQSASGGDGTTIAGGRAIRLRDIATVRQGFKERESIIRLGGDEAVELAIYKEGDANTVATADAIQARLAVIREELPPDMTLTVVDDQSKFVRAAIHDVRTDALIGGTLAVLIIFLFLRNGWSTLVVSLSLPVSIITTFFFMDQLGLSLNVMSLGGLALATGLVIDDSIVVLESIAKARERGLGVLEAAISGTREVGMAVVASTLTIIAVFLPLVFVEGIAGQLFRDQALTIAIAVGVSLLVAVTLIPMLASLKGRPPLAFPEEAPHPQWRPERRWQKPFAAAGRGVGAGIRGALFGIVWVVVRAWRGVSRVVGGVMGRASDLAMAPYARAERGYLRALPAALARPWLVLGAAMAVFAVSMLAVPLLGTDLIPQLAQDRFEMTAKLPPGTPLRETDRIMREVQQAHAGDDGVELLFGVSGSGTRLDANPTESGENIGRLSIVMSGGGSREFEALQTERLRETMRHHPGVAVDFARPQIFSFSTPLEIELRGQDLDGLAKAGQRMAELLRANPHYADVKSTVEQGFPEIQIVFDQERAGAFGLTTRQIADAVVRAVRGEVATRYNFRDRKIDVLVRAQERERDSVDRIRNLIVNPGSGAAVRLDSVADVVATIGPSEIHRADQVRVAVVSANLRSIDLGAAMAEVRQMVAQNPLGPEVGLHIGGQGEELAESMRSLLMAFALAIFLVYLVMASQFESLLHPFVILFTIPLAMVGAIGALLLTGNTISVVAFIGLILMVGLVVKNAIILIDKVNQLREAGVAKREALVEGARSRLRPIVMTTLSTLFGFLPLALAFGDGAEVRSPMAITVMGGLAVSTVLTLLVIPVVYDLLDRKSDAHYAERGRRARLGAAADRPDAEASAS